MATQKPKGWLDKYIATNVPKTFGKGVANTDATKVNKQVTPTTAKKVTQEQLDEREAQARRDRIAAANTAQPQMWNSPENFAAATNATGDKLRVSEYPNVFDDYVNLASMFGHLGSGLGQVPLNIQEGNYGQAAMNVANPVIAGAAEKLLTPVISKAQGSILPAIDRNFTQVGKQLAEIEKEGIAKGLSPHEIKMQQMDQVGITSNQRKAYIPGVSDLAYKYVRPFGYTGEGGESKLAETLKLIKKGGVKYSPAKTSEEEMFNLRMDEVPMVRRDSWRMYLGMPQQAETFNIAQTLPINHPAYNPTQLSNMEVFSIANDKAIKDLLPYTFKQDASGMTPKGIDNDLRYLTSDVVVDKSHSIMGGHNKRLTDNGLEYNDVWDLNPTVAPINFLPSKLKPKYYNSPLFVNKSAKGVESLREIEIPIDKFIGKPFMSHGVLPEYTKQELSNKLLSNPDLIGTSELYQQKLNKEIGNIIKKYNIKFKEGGWLEKYNDGGPVQENYNDYSVSAPEGYVGDGTFNEGRDYSPAWGGQFKNGGKTKKQPIYVTNKNDSRLRAYNDSLRLHNEGEKNYKKRLEFNKKNNIPESSTRTWNNPVEYDGYNLTKNQPIEGNGYLYNFNPDVVAGTNVPSRLTDNYGFRYKKPTQPVIYQKPEPTPPSTIDWLEGNSYTQDFVPQVEQTQQSVTPNYGEVIDSRTGYTHMTRDGVPMYQLSGQPKMAMGGSMPGAVGFMYARTGAPSKGPRRNQTSVTDASAQDGGNFPGKWTGDLRTIWNANKSARDFNLQYTQSPNFKNLLKKQGYTPDEIKQRHQAIVDLDASRTSYDAPEYNNVNPDIFGVERLEYDPRKLGDWDNWGDIAAHEWGHVGVTGGVGPTALKPAEQKLLTDSLNWKNVSTDPDARAHDVAPQENRADLVELRKALQDRKIYNSFKGGEFKQEHLDKLRQHDKIHHQDPEYWNRSMRLYKDKDIIKLMNTIASNDPQQGMPMAQNGMEMKYYQDGLDFKPKGMGKNGKVIKDDMGQWAHPGEITEIGSNQITMQGVPYPVLGISDTGDMQMMYPDEEYQYDGESVTEYPMMKQGGQLTKLDQLTNFTNYNTKQPGGWLDKYQ